MNPTLQRYLVSSLTTFAATFLTVLGGELSSGAQLTFTWAFAGSIVAVAIRAAVKAVIENFTPSTGDK